MKHVVRSFLRSTLPMAATILCPTLALANPALAHVDRADVSSEDTEDTGSDLSELEASGAAYREDSITADTEYGMSATDVEDPFPDRGEQTRPRDVWIPGTLGVGLAGAAVVMGRLALRPDCGSQDDVTTCTVPSGGDIGVRGGRVFGAAGFGIGGVAFGAVAGRQLGHWLDEHPDMSFERKRKIAVRAGTTAVVLGGTGMIVGATLLGVGTRQAISIGEEFEGVDTGALNQAQADRLDLGLGKVRIARTGLMLLVATPTLLATGIALLVNRPRGDRLGVSPALGPTHAGLSLRGRF